MLFNREMFVSLQSQMSGMLLSPVRVRVWGACGRWFESSHPDKKDFTSNCRVFFCILQHLFNTFCAIIIIFEVSLEDFLAHLQK